MGPGAGNGHAAPSPSLPFLSSPGASVLAFPPFQKSALFSALPLLSLLLPGFALRHFDTRTL